MQVRLDDLKIGSNVTGRRRRGCGCQLLDEFHSLPAQLLQCVCHAHSRAVVRIDQRHGLAAGPLLQGGCVNILQAREIIGYPFVDRAQLVLERVTRCSGLLKRRDRFSGRSVSREDVWFGLNLLGDRNDTAAESVEQG